MKIQISYDIELPDIPHTDKQLTEYLQYHYGWWPERPLNDNPFEKLETGFSEMLTDELDLMSFDYKKI